MYFIVSWLEGKNKPNKPSFVSFILKWKMVCIIIAELIWFCFYIFIVIFFYFLYKVEDNVTKKQLAANVYVLQFLYFFVGIAAIPGI